MPELPEVETVKRGLEKLLPGRVIRGVKSDWEKSFPNSSTDVESFMVGSKIVAVRRRAKVILIDLDSKYSLVIHLKMTGQLVFVKTSKTQKEYKNAKYLDKNSSHQQEERFGAGHPSNSLINNLPDKTTRVIIDLGDAKLYFNDQRKFGWVKLIPTIEIPNIDFFKKVGPEPLDSNFTANDFIKQLKNRPKTSIKAALLDQKVIAGVGNIYADESLFAARINPKSLVRYLSEYKLKVLYKELIKVLKLSIEKGGSTDRNYRDAEGNRGSYLTFARVFRRDGQPCLRCNVIISKIRVAGRGTHVCSKCQKIKVL